MWMILADVYLKHIHKPNNNYDICFEGFVASKFNCVRIFKLTNISANDSVAFIIVLILLDTQAFRNI